MAALFITATGTEIGKTFVAAGLLAALRRQGRQPVALKPILTGFDPDDFAASDPAVLLAACGRSADLAGIAEISPWRFAAPLSPDMAAAAEGRSLDATAVTRFCAAAVAAAQDGLVIEGIGGLMVPLGAGNTVCDLIAGLDIPAVLVAGTYLGSLSHTLCALTVAQARGLRIAALVLNETPGSTVPLEATHRSLRHFWPGPILDLRRTPGCAALIFEKLAEFLPAAGNSVA